MSCFKWGLLRGAAEIEEGGFTGVRNSSKKETSKLPLKMRKNEHRSVSFQLQQQKFDNKIWRGGADGGERGGGGLV